MLHTGGRTAESRVRIPRAPKQFAIHDYQFFDRKLSDLYEKETAFYRKENNIKAPLEEGTEDDLEARQAKQELMQDEIDTAIPLTEEEQEEKERLDMFRQNVVGTRIDRVISAVCIFPDGIGGISEVR